MNACLMICPESMAYPAPLTLSNLMCDWFLVCSFPSLTLLTVSGHYILRILRIHLFTKVWISCSMDFVVRQVSDPYISIGTG